MDVPVWKKAYWLIKEVGPVSLFSLAVYRLGIKSGYYHWLTPIGGKKLSHLPPLRADVFILPDPIKLSEWNHLRGEDGIAEAEEILAGKVRLFGGAPQPLNLKPPHPNRHWSVLREQGVEGDIKQIWEPARLGWAFPLGRAYRLTGDERYARCFWIYWEQFLENNPVNGGENWLSAQEVALRLMALAFAVQVFETSPWFNKERKRNVAESIVHHARRIEVTLLYARAQNNNHLLSEAVGLLLAAYLLPDWEEARRWRQTGWKWFEWAIEHQIEADGEYIQHSTNYHRLMLTLALIAHRIARLEGIPLTQGIREKLRLASAWLRGVMDETSGQALNLGHHDGAHLLPLGGHSEDFRPILQASTAAFTGERALPGGGWDELAHWFGLDLSRLPQQISQPALGGVRRLGDVTEWASLRAKKFTNRPAHADQLQVELWRHGVRLVSDAGTYAYNLPPPWQNGLALAELHNAPVFNRQQPMLRAGKFLWLNWDQAQFVEKKAVENEIVCAERYGYRRLGVQQQRRLEWVQRGCWKVTDRLLPLHPRLTSGQVSLHWLLQDGKWKPEDNGILMDYGEFQVRVSLNSQPSFTLEFKVVRAGQVLKGKPEEGLDTLLGWFSPTYLVRQPAISLWIQADVHLPVELQTDFEICAR